MLKHIGVNPMVNKPRSSIFAACVAVLALAFTPGIALGQPSQATDPATVPMSAHDSRAVILSLADLLRERFAFRERGVAAANEIEAMQQRGEFEDARSAAELLA